MSPSDDPRPQTTRAVLVMNHHRDAVEGLLAGLHTAGFVATATNSLGDTYRSLEHERPAAVIVNPLVLKAGGLEMEILESLQREEDPVPIILLLEDLRALEQARHLHAPFRDFVMKPYSVAECVHRIELALLTRSKFANLHRRTQELEGQVSVDFKTGLLSERHFRKILQIEFKRAQRHHTPLSLLLVDVDNFKHINDTTEYAFGDEVLCSVAQTLRQSTRETDFVARHGGDEFMSLLPHTTPAEAVQTAIRIRKMIGNLVVSNGTYTQKATVSIGIDTFDGHTASSPDDLRRRANKALHEAKRRGKNQVWLFSDLARGGEPEPEHGSAQNG